MSRFEIYLSPPHMSGREIGFIEEAFSSNWVAPLGPNVDAFEAQMSSYLGEGMHALALSSGTAALHLGLILAGVGPGDRVLCSSLTFIASANPIVYQGAEPVFVDSDPKTWNMSPASLRRAIEDLSRKGVRPKAIVIVNLYGQSADMDPLLAICAEHGIPVIEDAAESLGATYKGRKSGTFGMMSVISFNGNKLITTSGGGMLMSKDRALVDRARYLSTQARQPALHYEHTDIGYNYRMSNLLAGVGRAQLEVVDERVRTRRRIFDRYRSELEGPKLHFMDEADYGRATRWLTVALLDPAKSRVTPAELVTRLSEKRIEARPVWKPLHAQKVFAGKAYYPHDASRSVSDELFAHGICLPSGSSLTEDQQAWVIREIRSVLGD